MLTMSLFISKVDASVTIASGDANSTVTVTTNWGTASKKVRITVQ